MSELLFPQASERSFTVFAPTVSKETGNPLVHATVGFYVVDDLWRPGDGTYEGGLRRLTKNLFGEAVGPESTVYQHGVPLFFTPLISHVELAESQYKYRLEPLPMANEACLFDFVRFVRECVRSGGGFRG